MNSHAHVILELPEPKEVSMIWDLNRSASFSSKDFSRCTRRRERQSATNTPSYRCCPGSIFTSSASCVTLPVHRSSPALNAVELKVQIPMLSAKVWYLMTPWAPHPSSWLSHWNHPTHRSEFPMQRALVVEFDQPPLRPPAKICSRASREREREDEDEDLNTLPCRVRVVFNLF